MSLKFTVGDLTIHRVIEQETTFLPALEVLPGLTPELLAEHRSWMRETGALDAGDVLILCFQSYIVRTPHHTILIDSCIGNDKPRPLRPKWNMKTDDTYMRALAASGFSVGDIDFVMCTHLHVDHVGWNTRLENGRWLPTFPNARYVFGKNEFDYWTEQNAKAPVAPFADSVLPIVEANKAEIVRNDHQIGDHVRILPTPGHTPGHVAFTLGRGKDDAVFSGDLMHSPLQTRYPELSAKFDVDPAQAAATRAWSAIATPIRCAARRIFRRPRQERSAAGAADFPAKRSRRVRIGCNEIRSIRKGNGSKLPLPLRERVGVRGYGLTIDCNPSPGSHLTMRSDLSHKGRGEVSRRQNQFNRKPSRSRTTQSNRFGVWFTTAPSIASILSLVVTPPLAENPPGLPPAASTRWQGTTIGQGLRPSAWPTSRDNSTPPSRLAISP
jgi:glyoxylase-like metal-dependent hydrolase (beta-lactamase superfamily II)